MGKWIKELLNRLGWRQEPSRVPLIPRVAVDSRKQATNVARETSAKPTIQTTPLKTDTRPALQIGFDFGTHSTKIVVRRRGERLGQIVCIGGSTDGYPAFVVPSLVRVAEDSLWFGIEALNRSDGRLHQLLKLELLRPDSPSPSGTLSTDFLVTAYFGWILCGVRKWIEKRYGLENAKLFLNVAAPMDHYEDAAVKQRYLKILELAWGWIFGEEKKLITQGVNKAILEKWLSRKNVIVPDVSMRRYDVLPETVAPIVSLSQDPRMAAGMYLLVDMGAGTTELSINHVSRPGGNQNVLCYYDRSVLLGAERFQQSENPANLTSELMRHIWQTWCLGYQKDARNMAARQRWKSVRILLVGGGTRRKDVREAIAVYDHPVFSRFPGEGRCEILRHGPADLEFGPHRVSSEDFSLACVANGLAFPRMQWPRFYDPENVLPVGEGPTGGGPDGLWYLDR